MTRPAVVVAAGLALAFVGITILKTRDIRDDPAGPPSRAAPADRERVELFWTTYRTATSHRIAGRTAAAAEAYARALELNERHEDALYYLGNMRFALGEFSEAERAWRRLAEVNPQSSRAHSRLGDLYSCLDKGAPADLGAARAAFERALEINQEETGPLLRLGQVALLVNDMATAHYYLDAVIGSNEESVEAHYLKGYLAWGSGENDLASTMLAAAVRYAQTTSPGDSTPREGDTRAGSAPLTDARTTCQGMQAYVDELATSDVGASSPRVVRQYRRFDTFVKGARRRFGPTIAKPSS